MRKLILTALAAMLASGAAYAQNNNNHHGGPGNPPNHGNPNLPAGHPGPAPAAVHPGPVIGQPHAMPAGGHMGGSRQGNGNGFGSGHHLPPGISIPTARHSAPQWRGRSWGIGDVFILTGFDGPYIRDWGGYGLSPPRRGTHWIYVDGYYLLVGNRTGRIFAEVAADY